MSQKIASHLKPLFDLSERQIREIATANAEFVVYSYNDYMAELDRRAANRQARASVLLSVVSVSIAVAAVLVAALRP
jgi:hypothetical protein